ncbi:carbohydrate ABC transporter permease [Vallitalea pronyensis]|uniref:Carbohydrate ABC transporter permease n=1 Tax=Vallitalea pronyensis TaxID=1348613 RepID=A0A8J8MJA3_9FIRM|nr:carbohydrate ABC transporter permease [Vallitalea pronyensis]QUI22298.1 carbohydrate ABC transporter permease [Vallitalea pronyensis]
MKTSEYETLKENMRHRGYVLSRKLMKGLWSLIRSVLIIGICFVIIYPLLSKISVSFMEEIDFYDASVKYIPRHFTWNNYVEAFQGIKFPETFRNTIFLSLVTSIFHMASCTFVAYGFARFQFKWKKVLLALVVISIVIPPQVTMVSNYINFKYFDIFGIYKLITGNQGINLLNSFAPFFILGITASGIKNGLYIFLMIQYFRGMPKALDEAAYIDGASFFQVFRYIMLPGAIPMMATVFLFSFVWQYNDVYYATILFTELQVFSTSIQGLARTTLWDVTSSIGSESNMAYQALIRSAATVMVIAPLIVLYTFTQKLFVESVSRSGLKL